MSVVRHMFNGSFGTQNTMVAFSFRFDQRKGQYNVKLGQKVKFSKSIFSSKNMLIMSSFVSGFQKCYFLPTAIRNTKNCISKSDVITFTWFFDHCTAKYKYIGLKFGICVVSMQLCNIYSVFWIISKFWILYAFIFEKKKSKF